jgi:hypothetical protein
MCIMIEGCLLIFLLSWIFSIILVICLQEIGNIYWVWLLFFVGIFRRNKIV